MAYSIALFIGIVLFLLSLFFLKESLSFLKTTERAVGNVIELEKVNDSDGGYTYKAVLKFKAAMGKEVIFKERGSSKPASWQVGEEAMVAYDPNHPEMARTLTYFSIFGLPMILMAIAMPMLVVSGGFYWAQTVLK
jgi:hypothetical protein